MARTPKIPGEPTTEQQAPEPAPEATLPNFMDVDPHEIKEPTLTRQGWVVPAPKPKA